MRGTQGIGFVVLKLWFIFVAFKETYGRQIDVYEHSGRELIASDGFINIACGAPESYKDMGTGRPFENDTKYVQGGKSMAISQPFFDAPWYRQQHKYLRSFPQGKRHCYSAHPGSVGGGGGGDRNNVSYLITASFLYGNYDGESKPPNFDMYLGVTYWSTMYLQNIPAESVVYIDAIHVVEKSTDAIDVCLVDTGSGTPFISSLQIRPLKSNSMYKDKIIKSSGNKMLFNLLGRFDCGTVLPGSHSYWYGDDVYDRFWNSYNANSPQEKQINTTKSIFAIEYGDPPPVDVLRTAITPSDNTTRKIEFSLMNYPISDFIVYLHFAEIAEPEKDNRKFTVALTNDGATNGTYSLDYMKPMSLSFQVSSQGGFKFSIAATNDSLLPPILNAFEIFHVVHISEVSTNQDDVNAIKEVKQHYGISNEDWQGDPCLPIEYMWTRVHCNSQNPSRIILLNLSSSGLAGNIAASLSQLKSIQILDLSYNNLTGTLPESFAELSSLKVLNLTGNQLEGLVPKALLEKYNSGELTILSLNGNLKLCFQPELCKVHETNNTKMIVIIVVSSAIVIILVLLSLFVIRHWFGISKNHRAMVTTGPTTTEDRSENIKLWSCRPKNRRFTYSEILNITDHFSSLIGQGGFGKVYLGKLEDDQCDAQVAVKLLSPSSRQGPEEFQNEVELLMGIHHRNLVSLFGYCNEAGKMAIIYEYVANGSLDKLISANARNGNVLPWMERLQIALDTARGLEYLHNDCKPSIVHRDLKTSNILLTEKLQAKIADFGLGKAFPTETASYVSSDPKGTIGYLDPEYYNTRKLNKKSDIYSFGVVLLELITGQQVIAKEPPHSHIAIRISPQFESRDVKTIADPRLIESVDYDPNSMWKVLETAMACVSQTAVQRPEISQVCNELKESLKIEIASRNSV